MLEFYFYFGCFWPSVSGKTLFSAPSVYFHELTFSAQFLEFNQSKLWGTRVENCLENCLLVFRKFRLSYFNVCWLYLPNIMLLKMCFVLKISCCLVAFIELVRLNFTYPFEWHTPERDIWIDEPLMPSSHTITRKPGGDYDWLIVQICT